MKKPDSYPTRTDADYRTALALVAPYFDNEPEIGSDAGAYFEAIVTLIEAYEATFGHRRYYNRASNSVFFVINSSSLMSALLRKSASFSIMRKMSASPAMALPDRCCAAE